MANDLLQTRHIQNFSEAQALEPHWGYADRAIPCTNDAGSCRYLDIVYHSHDLGMLYCGIIWATFFSILLVWWAGRKVLSNKPTISNSYRDNKRSSSTVSRLQLSAASVFRRHLLPDFARPIFGRTTRLQVLILGLLAAYVAVFSFTGIVYSRWITPVKKMPGVYNTRTSLGPWSNRIGTLAFALTPLSVLLSSRESLLSLITGLPYQSFNFLHRWLGYIIVVQSSLHTVGWCIVELRLYQPQPKVGIEWIKQLYMIWGIIAMFFLFALFILSTPWAIRLTGYEFFRKSHYVLAMLYIGGCIGHWQQLQCFMIPSLAVWFFDRTARFIRTALIHYTYESDNRMSLRATDADITHFPDPVNGDVVRLDFSHPHDPWQIGQHFYLTFSRSSIWQSHPFTPLSNPVVRAGKVTHSYVFRAKAGETKKIAELAATAIKRTTSNVSDQDTAQVTTPVLLTGPYGKTIISNLTAQTNILCVAGGTGITYVLPVLLAQIIDAGCQCSSPRKMSLIWAVRRKADIAWVRRELDTIHEASKAVDLKVHIFVTRENPRMAENATGKQSDLEKEVTVTERALSSSRSASSTDTEIACCAPVSAPKSCSPPQDRRQSITIERHGSFEATPPELRHPDLDSLVRDFVNDTARGETCLFASGPGGMISDLRRIVAGLNDGRRVWRGDERASVRLECDDRLEW